MKIGNANEFKPIWNRTTAVDGKTGNNCEAVAPVKTEYQTGNVSDTWCICENLILDYQK